MAQAAIGRVDRENYKIPKINRVIEFVVGSVVVLAVIRASNVIPEAPVVASGLKPEPQRVPLAQEYDQQYRISVPKGEFGVFPRFDDPNMRDLVFLQKCAGNEGSRVSVVIDPSLSIGKAQEINYAINESSTARIDLLLLNSGDDTSILTAARTVDAAGNTSIAYQLRPGSASSAAFAAANVLANQAGCGNSY